VQIKFIKAVSKDLFSKKIEINTWKEFVDICNENEIDPETVVCRYYCSEDDQNGWDDVWVIFADYKTLISESVIPVAFSNENVLQLKK
jgi:hypothetical protein